jgi:hypothetical protein
LEGAALGAAYTLEMDIEKIIEITIAYRTDVKVDFEVCKFLNFFNGSS